MEQRKITLDAHTLIWYVHRPSKSNLSTLALEAIRAAEHTGTIYIPIIALLEILSVVEKGKYPISFNTLLSRLERGTSYQIVPFGVDLLRIAERLSGLELHDRLIVATAIMTDSVLVSKDRVIGDSGINVVW